MLDERRRLYEATGNPLWLWQAYRLCRDVRCQIPEWFFAYLDRAAKRLTAVELFGFDRSADAADGFGRTADADGFFRTALEAFEFKRVGARGGPGRDKLAAYQRELNTYSTAVRVRVLLADGLSITYACMLTAQYYRLPESTVRRHWDDFRAVVEAIDLRALRAAIARENAVFGPPRRH